MGLFDFTKSIMGVSNDNQHHNFSLKEYGVASAQWSAMHSQMLIDSILQLPKMPREDGTSLIAEIEKYPKVADMVFIGLYVATYLVYAIKGTSKNSFSNLDFIRKLNFFDVKMNLRRESHEILLFPGFFPRFTLQWAHLSCCLAWGNWKRTCSRISAN